MTQPTSAGRIYLSSPDVGEDERNAILRAFDSGWIAPVGQEIDGFEAEIADYVGGASAVAVSSGTAALRLALALYGIGAGDEVVVGSATFAASAFAVVHAGATPVFCDSDAGTWCMDPALLTDFLEQRSREGRLPAAVMPVSLYGSTPDYVRLAAVCAEFDVPIVEDAAEALGSISDVGPVGSGEHVTIFSFNGNKIITASSGGALIGSPEQCERVRYLATQARMPVAHYEHTDIGFNFRLSNLLAALARAQLMRLEGFIERRTAINARYREAFKEFRWCPHEHTVRPNNWLSVALVPESIDPAAIAADLGADNIEARHAWKPMHLQPVFSGAEMIGSGAVSEAIFDKGLCLPSGSSLDDGDVDRVIDAVQESLQHS